MGSILTLPVPISEDSVSSSRVQSNSIRWASVRPVRSRAQIFAAVGFLSSSGGVRIEELAKRLAAQRISDEENRLHSLGVSNLRLRRAAKGEAYLTYTNQMVRLLKFAGLVTVRHRLISPTEDCFIIREKMETDPTKADEMFLQKTVNSRFKSYWRYLLALFDLGELRIPRRFSKRDENFSKFVASIGIKLNAVSFYSLRDFFYDFGLLNYFIDDEEERIVPLYSIANSQNNSYQAFFRSPTGWVSYRRRLGDHEFRQALAETYYGLTRGTNRIVELIELREKVSQRCLISERQFNELFSRAISTPEELSIKPSIGDLTFRSRTGMKTKVLSLPRSPRNYPYTLVRIYGGKN